ncbi:MAG: pyruvate kinase [Clostridia bacterium]|nr:pyruvate kinase [Clostridia bacterium]
MRKTKIVCTIGPASNNEQTLTQMCRAGMNVARLNFSHGTYEDHKKNIELITRVRETLGLPIAIMLDTKGPEYRIGIFEDGKIQLHSDDTFTFTTEDIIGNGERVSVSYKDLPKDLEIGDRILLNNGLLIFEVTSLTDTDVVCRVIVGGELSNRKSMSFPNKVLKQVYLSEQDKSDLLFGIEHGVDFIACSFTSRKQDLLDIKKFLQEHNAPNIELIAKIENQAGIDNIEEICSECSGIMIGRGDMGVEIAYEKLPAIQKHLITKCRMLGKRVITATEMLESMIHNPRPTRAEISDVANAVYDGSSAVMLSGETAAGKYPAEAVAAMARITEETEKNIRFDEQFRKEEFKIKNSVDAISHSTCGMAIDLGASAIVVCSHSGMTVRMVSRFRSPVDIIGLTTDPTVYRQLALSWGVTPVLTEAYPSTEVLFYVAKKTAIKTFHLKTGDDIIITGGATTGVSGNTDLIKIEHV